MAINQSALNKFKAYDSIIRKHVLTLSIHHLVSAEPVSHLIKIVVEVFEEVTVI